MAPGCKVEFRTGIAEPQAYALGLARKAWRAGARVLVLAPASALPALDRALWTGAERDFLPHALLGQAPPAVLRRSPVWLAAGIDDALEQARACAAAGPWVAIGLGVAWPEDAPALQAALQPLERLIQLVGTDADAVAAGRRQWRAFQALQEQGLALEHVAAARP